MTYEELKAANAQIKTTPIKGKDYAEVNQRIKVFRMLHPDGCISTEIISINNGICIMKATVFDANGKKLGTGTAYEKEDSTFINKTSYIENCETSAVGRALGMLGIGIDTSIASFEEMSNAITNQKKDTKHNCDTKDNKKDPQYDPSNDLIDDIKINVLKDKINKKPVKTDKLLQYYNINSFEEMKMSDWKNAMDILDKYEDVEIPDLGI